MIKFRPKLGSVLSNLAFGANFYFWVFDNAWVPIDMIFCLDI